MKPPFAIGSDWRNRVINDLLTTILIQAIPYDHVTPILEVV